MVLFSINKVNTHKDQMQHLPGIKMPFSALAEKGIHYFDHVAFRHSRFCGNLLA